MRPTRPMAVYLSDETLKLIRHGWMATRVTAQLRGKPVSPINMDSVLNEAMQAYLHHQVRALRSVGGTWEMVLDHLERRANKKRSQLPADSSADAGDIVEE